MSKDVLVQVAKYPKFSNYFQKKLKPTVEAGVNLPSRNSISVTNWTNNNCESLNHIMKLDANWKVKTTPDLIQMLHDMTLLHFKYFRRAMYGDGNYRLYGTYKKCLFGRNVWNNLDEAGRQKKFSDFLKGKRRAKVEDHENIVSTYSNFEVPALNIAKKTGQKTINKTINLKPRTKDLRRKMFSDAS